MRRNRQGQLRRRDDTGETLGLLVLWPALIVGILLLLVHAFIVTNAQSEAQVAASRGLRSAWRFSANEDFLNERVQDAERPGRLHVQRPCPTYGTEPHPAVLGMAGDGPRHRRPGGLRHAGVAVVDTGRDPGVQRLVRPRRSQQHRRPPRPS